MLNNRSTVKCAMTTVMVPVGEAQKISYPTLLDVTGYPAPPSKIVGDLSGLAAQPLNAKGSIILLETRGGADKSGLDGHRGDSLPICNEIIDRGYKCVPIFYEDMNIEKVYNYCAQADGIIVRVSPGTYPGVSQRKLDNMIRDLANKDIAVMTHPDVDMAMNEADALVAIRDLTCGLPDTYAYYDVRTFQSQFPRTIALRPRVLKQSRGNDEEGVWVVKRKDGKYGQPLLGSSMLVLEEAASGRVKEQSLDEFMSSQAQFLDGGRGDMMIDQRFLPRIIEGEIRILMIGTEPAQIIHKRIASDGGRASYASYKPEDPEFALLMSNFTADLPRIMPSFRLSGQSLPLLWTADFILGDKNADGSDSYHIASLNCGCVGINKQLYLAPQVADAALQVVEQSKTAEKRGR